MNNGHFENLEATIDIKRSTFKKPYQHKGSANLGEIIPFYVEEILPGSTYKIDTASLIRTGTLIAPLMSNLYFDIYYFFVPNRIVWNHWKQFMGENDTSAWTQSTEYTIPSQNLTTENEKLKYQKLVTGKSLFNYLTGTTLIDYEIVPTLDTLKNINELPLRAYWEIYNCWFRNENIEEPRLYTKEDTSNFETIPYTESPAIANKFKDFATSCLPAPQKGESVSIPLGNYAKLRTLDKSDDITNYFISNPALWYSGHTSEAGRLLMTVNTGSGKNYIAEGNTASSESKTVVDKTNIVADLSEATAATINQLRFAFQLQKFYEKGALYGTRYQETLKAMFGVNANAARLDIPEYLTGERIKVNIDQVLSTAQTGDNENIQNPQGNTAGWSCTSNYTKGFTKSFEEHGYVLGLCVLRQDNEYSAALPKTFMRRNKFDYYFPVFANIGNQPIMQSEINVSYKQDEEKDNIFGYQEAWADYRYKLNQTSGIINPNADNSLNYWTLTYKTEEFLPNLNKEAIKATKAPLDRALAATSEATGAQYIFDIYVDCKATLPMPLFSVPGLIDHH